MTTMKEVNEIKFEPGLSLCGGCPHLTLSSCGWFCFYESETMICAYPDKTQIRLKEQSDKMEQQIYDFSAVEGAIEAVEFNHPLISHLADWAFMLAVYRTDPDNFSLTANDVLGSVVERIIKLVGSMDRPLMLERFQGYARLILSEADFHKHVTAPQITYDFDQLAKSEAGQEHLIEEIITLRDCVIQGNKVGMGNISNAFVNLVVATRIRPRLEARLFKYLEFLNEFPDDNDEVEEGQL